MIRNDRELEAMMDRITRFQLQLDHLRRAESNPVNYRLSAAGFLAQLDRMNLEVREYLQLHPSEVPTTA
jgi:hypothetical protein